MATIRIIKTDPRNIDYIKVSAELVIDGAKHVDYEEHASFTGNIVDSLTTVGGGSFDQARSLWVGNFLRNKQWDRNAAPSQIQIDNDEARAITSLRVSVDFQLGGAWHSDFEDLGNFDRDFQLSLNGLGGGWNGERFVGNFLRADSGAAFSAAPVSGKYTEAASDEMGIRVARALQASFGLDNV
jgi:hypothetical protein